MKNYIFYSTSLALGLLLAGNTQAAPMTRVVNADEPLVKACSAAISTKIKAAYGSQASLIIDSSKLTGYFVSNHGIEGLRGVGNVKNDKAGKMPSLSFDCVVDVNKNKATKASYKLAASTANTGPATRPVSADESLVKVCALAVNSKLKSKYGRNASLLVDSNKLTGYFVSNHGIEGVRGVGNVKNATTSKMPRLKFDCVVDLNKQKATKVSYTLMK